MTMEEWMKNALNTPLMTAEEWRAMFDPIRQEVVIQTKSEMVNLDHARFNPCPNCGANDWSPTFMLRSRPGDGLYELIDYSCAYCGTRKEKL